MRKDDCYLSPGYKNEGLIFPDHAEVGYLL